MANIVAFKGVTYNTKKVDINKVVAPPYDVISQKYRTELYERDPYNVIRLILGKEENWYSSAAKSFNKWLEEGILIRDEKPTIYYLQQEFEVNGKKYKRGGFISLIELVEWDKNVVLRHEITLAGPKVDRLELMKATNANFEQIYGLYKDSEKKIDSIFKTVLKKSPDLDVTIENVKNMVWKLQDEKAIQSIIDEMRSKQIFIADGHHRYETGLTYRDFRREQEKNFTGKELYNYILMFLTNVEDEGLVIQPTHRAIFDLPNFNYENFRVQIEKYFEWTEYSDKNEALSVLEKLDHFSFVLSVKGKKEYVVIKLKDEKLLKEMIDDVTSEKVIKLDVTILHSYIIRKVLGITKEAQLKKLNLDYEKDIDFTLNLLNEEKYQLVFILNPTKIDELVSIASEGGTMPQKSTYFFPKMYSGILFSPFN